MAFNNTLKRGGLQVTKTAEDGLVEGIRFHLYGTSASGANVDEYATTNAQGVATFSNIPIGTGYTVADFQTIGLNQIPDNKLLIVTGLNIGNEDLIRTKRLYKLLLIGKDIGLMFIIYRKNT